MRKLGYLQLLIIVIYSTHSIYPFIQFMQCVCETHSPVVLRCVIIFHPITLYSRAWFFRSIQKACQFSGRIVFSINCKSYLRFFNLFVLIDLSMSFL